MNVLIVAVPAIIGAIGTIVSVYVAGVMQHVRRQTNGALDQLALRVHELELNARHAQRSPHDVRSPQ